MNAEYPFDMSVLELDALNRAFSTRSDFGATKLGTVILGVLLY
jgi:hypothetical protein